MPAKKPSKSKSTDRSNLGTKLTAGSELAAIRVKGARTHNLKNIDVDMPRNRMVVITGLSGSGKSSLAFDTIFAEGQRKYVESLSSYARQFLHQMQKPDVDEIEGLSPAIAIDQRARSSNPRSTVATVTEVYDYLRVFFARVARPHCLHCGDEISRMTNEEIKNFVLQKVSSLKSAAREREKQSLNLPLYLEIRAPIVRGRKGEYYQLLYDLLGKGYSEVVVDGQRKKLRERIELEKNKTHEIDVVVDQISVREFNDAPKDAEERLSEAIARSLEESDGLVRAGFRDPANEEKGSSVAGVKLPEEMLMSARFSCPKDGYSFPEIEPRLFSFNSPYGACPDCNGLGTRFFYSEEPCPNCNGARLREEALHVYLKSPKQRLNIKDFTALPITVAKEFLESLTLNEREKEISGVLMREIQSRLQFMIDVGIEYLTLDRRAHTLSGGEAQRIRLATQLGSGLVGATYVLDEPTIGLHSRDNDRLLKTLSNLRDLGNTIIVVEHDEDTILTADYLIDIGPGAGVHGGEVVIAGWIDDLLKGKNSAKSLTLDYLQGKRTVPVPEKRRDSPKGKLIVKGGRINNIKDLSCEVPLGRFNVITGVSGSGKSSFLYDILNRNLLAKLHKRHRSAEVYNCASFEGVEYIGRSVMIDQSPIGKTPRSNPATYTGAFTHIRDLFAASVEARSRGWKAGRFSFNVKGGRCEACQGNGQIAVEMHFLPTVYVPCDVCRGRRYTKETLEVKYQGKNIHEVLKMTVEEALEFFEGIPAIYDRLKTMSDVGLGYLELGQSATTLSGGEAQRVKISSELYRQHTEKTVYLLDEPTIGLHYEDVRNLINILEMLVSKGNTVVVIEHNLDLIKSADYIIDFGPEGGTGGGQIVAKGTPEEVAGLATPEKGRKLKKGELSHTGEYLKRILVNTKNRQ